MPRNKFVRHLTFGSLNFTQGTILGFFADLNALYLLDIGLQMTDEGIFGLIALLPFVQDWPLNHQRSRKSVSHGTPQTPHFHRFSRPVFMFAYGTLY